MVPGNGLDYNVAQKKHAQVDCYLLSQPVHGYCTFHLRPVGLHKMAATFPSTAVGLPLHSI
ncbi:hypothetical protein FBU59_000735 [Linderina macrospora]|uniref:Uncharacterized protein n=1 Tax=Linderina macrospora TaxID=4868 RepID=A0ACC1JG65_9FUNG|nr:hypothetical protein FBU59_000735 [Linderina macrospora]